MLRHGLLHFSPPDILRFFGRRIRLGGTVPERFSEEITTSLKVRILGARLKHWLQGNSLKGSGKAQTPVGDVFRVETMTGNVDVFKTYRPAEGGPEDQLQWRRMRRGVADLQRRACLSQTANERYLDAFAPLDDSTRMAELIGPLQQPCQYHKQRVRALHPFRADDCCLLQAINRGEFAINGLRNRDLQRLLYADIPADLQQKRRRSAAVSRKLRLLRAHGLIHKVPKTHRYQVTEAGRRAIAAVLTIQQTSMATLNRVAA